MKETDKYYFLSSLLFLALSSSNSEEVNSILYPSFLLLFLFYGIIRKKSLVELYFLVYFFSLEILAESAYINIINSIPIFVMLIDLLILKSKSRRKPKHFIAVFSAVMLLLGMSKSISMLRFDIDFYSLANLTVLLVIIYYYFHTFSMVNYVNLLNTFVLISFFVSLRVLLAFITGENLLNSDSQVSFENAEIYGYIFRATYFISSYFFVIGFGCIVSVYYFIYEKSFFWMLGIALTLSVILLNINISAIIGLLIALIYLLISLKKLSLKIILIAVPVIIIMGSSILSLLPYGDLVISRLKFEDVSSLFFRFVVFAGALNVYVSDFVLFLFGTGTEATLRFSNFELIQSIKYNSAALKSEGAIDSNWLTLLIENGIFLFAIVMTLLVKALTSKNKGSFSILNRSLLMFFSVTGLTQIFMYAKVGSIFYLILSSAFLLKHTYDYSGRCK